MFGFGRLGSYTYFARVQRELAARFADAGIELAVHVIEELPTASIRRRATRLAEIVAQTSGNSDPIEPMWLPRLRSVTAMNTPHLGTPLASSFAIANGAPLTEIDHGNTVLLMYAHASRFTCSATPA